MSATARLLRSENRAAPTLSQRAACWSFFGLLIIGPICFGATEPWSLLILQTSSVAVLILWLTSAPAPLYLELDLPTALLAAFGLVVIVQLLLNTTSYQYATRQELLKLTAYFVLFFLARQLLRTHSMRQVFSQILSAFGGIFALFAIVQRLHGNGHIYWLRTTETQSFFGSYANKNHYAGLMEMLIPFALLNAVNAGEKQSKRILFAFAASVMIASVFLSGSRGGILSTVFELALFSTARLLVSSKPRSVPGVPALTVALMIALVIWIGGQALINTVVPFREVTTDASLSNRLQILHDSLQLIKQRPLFGWGLGTFSTVYPQVQSWYSDLLVNAAHDDYLQLLVENGAVGLSVILCFLIVVFRVGLDRALRAPRSVTFAGLVGCMGLLLHSFTDFNMLVPANATLFFALCALICAASGKSVSKPGTDWQVPTGAAPRFTRN